MRFGMLGLTMRVALVAAACTPEPATPQTPAHEAPSARPRPAAPAASTAATVAADAAEPSDAAGESVTCDATAALPGLAVENAAWVQDVSQNVAYGLQVLSCAKMASDTAPEDLFGTSSFVACSPPRLCSAGPDRKRSTADDACAQLVEGRSTAPRPRAGWTRRFLIVTEQMRPGCGAADAAVVHFYAGLMRGDGSHLGALPPRAEWTDMLTRKMARHDRFFIRGARLQGLACSENGCRFEVRLEVSRTPNSRVSSGVDQGIVERRGDLWTITRPPT